MQIFHVTQHRKDIITFDQRSTSAKHLRTIVVHYIHAIVSLIGCAHKIGFQFVHINRHTAIGNGPHFVTILYLKRFIKALKETHLRLVRCQRLKHIVNPLRRINKIFHSGQCSLRTCLRIIGASAVYRDQLITGLIKQVKFRLIF